MSENDFSFYQTLKFLQKNIGKMISKMDIIIDILYR